MSKSVHKTNLTLLFGVLVLIFSIHTLEMYSPQSTRANVNIKASSPSDITGKPILYDAIHDPTMDLDYEYIEWFLEEYNEVIDYQDTGILDIYRLSQYNSIFIPFSDGLYLPEELEALTEFVNTGGKIFFVGEVVNLLKGGSQQILNTFGFSNGSVNMEDSDDADGAGTWVYYDSENIAQEPLMNGVSDYLGVAGSFVGSMPEGTRFLIHSDNDGTATFDYVPVMTQTRIGMGEIVLLMDSGIFSNNSITLTSGETIMKDYGDHPMMVSNIMNWMQASKTPSSCLIDFTHDTTYMSLYAKRDSHFNNSVFEEFWAFCDFNTQAELDYNLLQHYTSLILPNSDTNLTAKEQLAVINFMQNGGKVLMLCYSPSSSGTAMLQLTESFGYTWEPDWLTDSDDNFGDPNWIELTTTNFIDDPLFDNVDRLIYSAGGVLNTTPSNTNTLMKADNDGTVNYPDGILMVEQDFGNGKLMILPEMTAFNTVMYTVDTVSVFGYEAVDHPQFRANIYDWLQTGTYELTEPTILSPNGGEAYNGTIDIQWSAANDSYGYEITYEVVLEVNGSWMVIGHELNTTSLMLNTTHYPNGSGYQIRVIADSMSGEWTEDVSDGTFTFDNLEVNLGGDSGDTNYLIIGGSAVGGIVLGGLITGLIISKKK